jgi:hypothetical protein
MGDNANFINVPASEVRRRTGEWIDWYNSGGKDGLRAKYDAEQRQRFRDNLHGETKGWINRRPLSEDEIESRVESRMSGGGDSWFNGNAKVDIHMHTVDGYAREIADLHNAATGDNDMLIRTFIWTWIVAHSAEPSNAVTAA